VATGNAERRNHIRSYAYIPLRRTTMRRILHDTSVGLFSALRGLATGPWTSSLRFLRPCNQVLPGAFSLGSRERRFCWIFTI